jgi:RNA polymerase sigma-70 factor, ECF subfamily
MKSADLHFSDALGIRAEFRRFGMRRLADDDTPIAVDLRSDIIAILPRLRRFCMAIARGSDAGDDLCQATIERALLRADQFEQGSRLDSWMYRIAQNIMIDQARRAKTRGVEIEVDDALGLVGDDGVQIVEGRSELARARDAMAALPDEQRMLMALVVLDGKSYKDAAEILGIPMGTVMSRIARARRSIDAYVHGTGAIAT